MLRRSFFKTLGSLLVFSLPKRRPRSVLGEESVVLRRKQLRSLVRVSDELMRDTVEWNKHFFAGGPSIPRR